MEVVDPALMAWRDEPEFMAAYDWMREQMAERVAGYAGGHPWWAWARRDSAARPPDLRAPASTALLNTEMAGAAANG